MFSNTTALDIAIGLIFVYLIYSLLINIITEMLSTWLGIRARLLRQGVDNLLNDKNPQQLGIDFGSWLKDIFLVEPKEFKFSNSGKFYKEETIRSLAKRGENAWYSFRNTKPSYISKEMYSRTVLNMLNRRGRGINEWSRIVFSVETNALHLEPDTNRQFQDMLIASDGQFELFQQLLQNSYSEMMDRVNGWYKRKIGLMIFWIGLLLCIGFNIDTIGIVKTLSHNPELRKELVQRATAAVEDSSSIAKIMRTRVDSIDVERSLKTLNLEIYHTVNTESVMAGGWEYPAQNEKIVFDSTNRKGLSAVMFSRDSLNKMISDLDKKINKAEKKDLALVNLVKDRQNQILELRKNLNLLSKFLDKNIVSVGSFDNKQQQIEIQRSPTFPEKVGFILHQLSPFHKKLWGLIITALALSLGANFWFDLLKKLVALRGAGVKPEEKAVSNPNYGNGIELKSKGLFIDTPDPILKTISENRKYWESVPGVIAINKAIFPGSGGRQVAGIEFIVDTDRIDLAQIPDSIPVIMGVVTHTIPVKKTTGKMGVLLDGDIFLKGYIYNPGTGKIGTPTGIVKNIRTGQRALLTCGHVTQIGASPFMDLSNSSIQRSVESQNTPQFVNLGILRNQILSSYVDAAVIDVPSDFNMNWMSNAHFNLREIKEFRKVERSEENNLEVKIHTLRGEKKAKMVSAGIDFKFNEGQSNEVRFFDLIAMLGASLAPADSPETSSMLTQSGDSGALITDSANKPIAILVGIALVGGQWYSFGIKIKDVFESIQIQPII